MEIVNLDTFLQKMIDIADSIAIKYRELKTMEQSSLRDNQVYQTTCKQLENNIKDEEYYYNALKKDNFTANELLKILSLKYNIKSQIVLSDKLLEITDFNGYERVFFKLYKIYCFDSEKYYEKYASGLKCILSTSDIKKQINVGLIFQKNILYEYNLVILSFIERLLNRSNIRNKNEFIRIKYLIMFLDEDIEQYFIKNKNKIECSPYLSFTMVGDLETMPRLVQKKYLQQALLNKITRITKKYLAEYHRTNSDDFIWQLAEVLMRSAIIFFDEETVAKSKEEFDDLVKKNYIHFIDKQEMVNKIHNIYDSTKKDKSNYKYLSLNREYFNLS